jgi:hypothetical protein
MSRPSKLSEAQWAEVLRCAANGESLGSLADRFGVSKGTVSKRISKRLGNVKTLAKTIASAETQLEEMPVLQRLATRSLADYLKSIGSNLATAAERNTRTSARLAALAETHMDKVESGELVSAPAVAALIDVSNKAAAIGVAFMTANKPKDDTNGKPTLEQLVTESMRSPE